MDKYGTCEKRKSMWKKNLTSYQVSSTLFVDLTLSLLKEHYSKGL